MAPYMIHQAERLKNSSTSLSRPSLYAKKKPVRDQYGHHLEEAEAQWIFERREVRLETRDLCGGGGGGGCSEDAPMEHGSTWKMKGSRQESKSIVLLVVTVPTESRIVLCSRGLEIPTELPADNGLGAAYAA